MSRLRCSHTKLTYSFILKLEKQPECITCQTPYTVKHFLIECDDLAFTRQYFSTQIWRTYLKMLTWIMFFFLEGNKSMPKKNEKYAHKYHTKWLLLNSWCNGYRHRKWTRRYKFKSWLRLIAFHIALILLGKVWIQLFSLQLWVNSRADLVLQPWWGN